MGEEQIGNGVCQGENVAEPSLISTKFAEASYLSKAEIAQLAEECAQRVGYKPGGDLASIVSALGGRIVVQDTLTQDPERSGSLFVRDRGDFAIVVPVHTSILRDKFTVAHELGHYFIHYLSSRNINKAASKTMIALRKGSERVEWEANWFAAAFLMPENEFRADYVTSGGDLNRLANKFSVSVKACEVRAKQLALTGS